MAEEFIAARSLIGEIHQRCRWSPWVLQDQASEYEAALQTCGQWACTDSAPPAKTVEEYVTELDQRLVEADARLDAEQAQADKDRAERARHYDPERHQVRLALLEEEAILADKIRQRDEIVSDGRFAFDDDKDRHRKLVASLERDIAARTREACDLAAVVGDPESVADADGWLPAERRELALILFKARRGAEVQDLRARVADSEAALKDLKGKSERAELREVLKIDRARLDWWENMPPLEASGMCSECVSPAWHTRGVTIDLTSGVMTGGPCPAWPRWAAGVNAVSEALRTPAQNPPKPLSLLPQPIAVLAPGVPIEEVIAQLTAIQAGHAGAQIRPGKGHRWEIWPAPKESESPETLTTPLASYALRCSSGVRQREQA